MVTAAGDEKKYQKWLGVLKYAAIWLAIVWLSWMIVSVIFWFVGTLWWNNQSQNEGQTEVDNTIGGSLKWTDGNWGGWETPNP